MTDDDILSLAWDNGITSDAALNAEIIAFARAIAIETLRRFGQLEALIRMLVPKAPPPHRPGPTLEILLLGACELLFLKVAPHAAVDAANRLAHGDAKAVHFKGLINAVLRRIAKEGDSVEKNIAEKYLEDIVEAFDYFFFNFN